MKQLNISPRVGRHVLFLLIALAFVGVLTMRHVLFASQATQESLRQAEDISAQSIVVATRSSQEPLNTAGAVKQETIEKEPEDNQTGPAATVLHESETEPAYVPPPAEPGDFPAHPPLCGFIHNTTEPGSGQPPRLQARIDQYQTNVVVSQYDFYVDDALVQSSASQFFVFEETQPGTYFIHAEMETNFGRTLKNINCTVPYTVE